MEGKVTPTSHHTYKKINSRQNKDLNIESQTLKILENSIEEINEAEEMFLK